jgi:ketosteroid isomerase-like protein
VTSGFDRIREVNDAVGAGDLRTLHEFLHPDVVWEHNLGAGSPEEGIYRGRESVVALFERIIEPWEYMRPNPREVRDRGGDAYDIRGELHAKHSTSAAEVVSPYVQHVEMTDGLLLRGRMTTGDDSGWQGGDIDVVREVVEAFRERDAARLRMLFDDGGEFRSALAGLEGGIYRFPDDVERYMSGLDDVFDDWHTEDERYLDAGDGRIVVVYRIVGRGRGSGAPVDQEMAIVWTVSDGKVRAGRSYLNPEEALALAE